LHGRAAGAQPQRRRSLSAGAADFEALRSGVNRAAANRRLGSDDGAVSSLSPPSVAAPARTAAAAGGTGIGGVSRSLNGGDGVRGTTADYSDGGDGARVSRSRGGGKEDFPSATSDGVGDATAASVADDDSDGRVSWTASAAAETSTRAGEATASASQHGPASTPNGGVLESHATDSKSTSSSGGSDGDGATADNTDTPVIPDDDSDTDASGRNGSGSTNGNGSGDTTAKPPPPLRKTNKKALVRPSAPASECPWLRQGGHLHDLTKVQMQHWVGTSPELSRVCVSLRAVG
jgi:hypothetical protein